MTEILLTGPLKGKWSLNAVYALKIIFNLYTKQTNLVKLEWEIVGLTSVRPFIPKTLKNWYQLLFRTGHTDYRRICLVVVHASMSGAMQHYQGINSNGHI